MEPDARRESPNHGPRHDGSRIDMAILHYTAMQDAETAIFRLCKPEAKVSCHYVICREGRVTQLVDEARRAWHAGLGRWGGVADVNSNSIGIELDHPGHGPFEEAQIAALEALLAEIMDRYPAITPERVLGHSDVAVGRKIDPGGDFPWRRLAAAGLAVWPEDAEEADPEGFHEALSRIGYDWNSERDARLAAFRLRFRPGAEGPVDAVDAGLAEAVAAHWPLARRSVIDLEGAGA